MQKHTSVLLKESLELLNIKEDGIYVDCTLGRAGHSAEILKKIKKGHLFAIDQDIEAIKESESVLKEIANNFTIMQGNFENIKVLLALEGVEKVDGILFDLGVSSPQFDVGDRGFSYRFDAELDMRMDKINNQLTAKFVINNYSERELADVFFKYGEESFSFQIARNIIKYREKKPLETTFELVDVIKKSLPQKVLKKKKHPAKKVFQALRIFVNNELEVLKKSLSHSLELLNKNGRLVVITFHSLEEKIIKDIFKANTVHSSDKFIAKLPIQVDLKNKDFELVIKKPIVPSDVELENNRRSRSAKLWSIKKVS
ncbi:16S rRNA (cytosine(1402)-N(4))-methyltransferase RsmH [Spiroplasma apis]|uniref:Ribosomal RNA small subunit methyltransferase H n=1 Tax=Spiroplasma apis B31 TaxID=1276258 RepID=V5RJF5_SPIAP|nr:16S rRNA (cytosine(1402)-N(4))-methyltransferase RsmH [Spiroplasma apis]AHB36593.1 S-adenosyl-methyltransferase MraW [Spiroplasma apis B31]